MAARKLLVVDDDTIICDYIRDVASAQGFEVSTAQRPEDALGHIRRFQPDVVLLDLVLPGTDGIELLRGLAEARCGVPVVVMSGLDMRTIQAARRLGKEHGLQMCGGIEKPFTAQTLRSTLDRILMDRRAVDREDLVDALEKEQLELHYQPKVSTRDGAVVGVESLVRWKHPDYGLLLPANFIPLAESTGLIRRLTRHVTRIAAAQAAIWATAGLDLPVAVNVSTHDLHDLAFPDFLGGLLAESGLDGSRLVVEVTESQVMSNTMEATEILTRLRLRGVEVAIDDFGTGFSSMALLQRLPFSEIKIDRSFVAEAASSRDARIIVRSIIDLGHNLGLRVVAEGVESEEVHHLLCHMGADVVQGFKVGAPMPADALEEWIAAQEESRRARA